jgi:hypothetical protein
MGTHTRILGRPKKSPFQGTKVRGAVLLKLFGLWWTVDADGHWGFIA